MKLKHRTRDTLATTGCIAGAIVGTLLLFTATVLGACGVDFSTWFVVAGVLIYTVAMVVGLSPSSAATSKEGRASIYI